MQIKTSRKFNATPEKLWPLLFNSKMDEEQPCYFLCGLPKPVECRLKDDGGVGATRECVSDKGVIVQNILEWVPQSKLRFELTQTNIYFGPCVKSIVEGFEIQKVSDKQSIITRQTDFVIKSPFRLFLAIPMAIGLKSIHRYVFKNWQRLSR